MRAMIQALAILEKLISFPTVSKDSNLALTDYVQQFLSELGIQSSIVYNEEKTKAKKQKIIAEDEYLIADFILKY